MGKNVEVWLEIVSLVFTVIGGIFIYIQWQKSIKTKRAEFIHQILDKLRFDEDLLEATYILDYNESDWYNASFHNGKNNMEHIIDKLFCYIDYICYLRSTRNISETEFKIFKYEVHRICQGYSAQAYLWNLYHFARRNETCCSFQNIIDYGIEKGIFPKEFTTNTKLYRKQLNF